MNNNTITMLQITGECESTIKTSGFYVIIDTLVEVSDYRDNIQRGGNYYTFFKTDIGSFCDDWDSFIVFQTSIEEVKEKIMECFENETYSELVNLSKILEVVQEFINK